MNAPTAQAPELWTCHLGTVPYREATALQEQLRERRIAEHVPDTLLLLEHPPVYTRGRRSRPDELALGDSFYRAKGIAVFDTKRGGRVTYHGPGQLVGYAIMKVRDVGQHLRKIEAALIATLAEFGVTARSRRDEGPDYTGVWVADRKIASIGVHVSQGVSTHGFALNVNNDLKPFSWVVACGLPDVQMTSLAAELARDDASDSRFARDDASDSRQTDADMSRLWFARDDASASPAASPGLRDDVFDSPGVSPGGRDDVSKLLVLRARTRARAYTHFCKAHNRAPRLVEPGELRIDIPSSRPAILASPQPRPRGRMPRAHPHPDPSPSCADATQNSPAHRPSSSLAGPAPA